MAWYECVAQSATRDAWMVATGPGRPELGPWVLPDGRAVDDLIADGDVDQIPFDVCFEPSNYGKRYGDLLWTGGMAYKLASQRFVEVLESIAATGYKTFPVRLRDNKKNIIDGYVGFATLKEPDEEDDIKPLNGAQMPWFLINQRVRDAIVEAGLERIAITPYDPDEYA